MQLQKLTFALYSRAPLGRTPLGNRNLSFIEKAVLSSGVLNDILIHFGTYTNALYIEDVPDLGVSF